jgi:hypothetical protein
MGGITTDFHAKKGETIVRGTVSVEGSPNDNEWAQTLVAAVYERMAELEREGECEGEFDRDAE